MKQARVCEVRTTKSFKQKKTSQEAKQGKKEEALQFKLPKGFI